MTIDSPAALGRESVADRPAQFRYGAVFLLTMAVVVFVIAAPSADWSRAVTLALEGAALVVAVATAREREWVRHRRALVVGVGMIVLILGVGTGAVSEQLVAVLLALVTAAVPVGIVRGMVRLLRERGVTVQAVAGALAIYLSIGLVFAWVISFIAHVDSTPYFAQHTNGTVDGAIARRLQPSLSTPHGGRGFTRVSINHPGEHYCELMTGGPSSAMMLQATNPRI